MRCSNCGTPFTDGDDAYAIERGRVEFNDYSGDLWFMGRSNLPGPDLILCAECYDDTWLIGEPLPKNEHLSNG